MSEETRELLQLRQLLEQLDFVTLKLKGIKRESRKKATDCLRKLMPRANDTGNAFPKK